MKERPETCVTPCYPLVFQGDPWQTHKRAEGSKMVDNRYTPLCGAPTIFSPKSPKKSHSLWRFTKPMFNIRKTSCERFFGQFWEARWIHQEGFSWRGESQKTWQGDTCHVLNLFRFRGNCSWALFWAPFVTGNHPQGMNEEGLTGLCEGCKMCKTFDLPKAQGGFSNPQRLKNRKAVKVVRFVRLAPERFIFEDIKFWVLRKVRTASNSMGTHFLWINKSWNLPCQESTHKKFLTLTISKIK